MGEVISCYLNENILDIDMSKLEKNQTIFISEENIKATISDLSFEEPKIRALF